jgi:hypothetical protein
MVFSHDLRWDELSFAFVTVAADIHVCADNVRQVKMRGKRGDHVITRRQERFATSQNFIYCTASKQFNNREV